MRIALAAFTDRGAALAKEIASGLAERGEVCRISVPERMAERNGLPAMSSLEAWSAAAFAGSDALIFVGAAGIAVRAVAPHLEDKLTDPAVVLIDEAGGFVIPLLSGHVGGANRLSREIAEITGARTVISTATDVNSMFAVDEWASMNHLHMADRGTAKRISAALLEGRPVSFSSAFPVHGTLPPGIAYGRGALGFCVTLREDDRPFGDTLRLFPKILILGIGCRRGIRSRTIEDAVSKALRAGKLSRHAVAAVSTIDLKKDEAGLLAFCGRHGLPLETYSAAELGKATGEFMESDFVKDTTGVGNVCERAAVMSGGRLMIKKLALDGVTVAVSARPFTVRF